MDKFDAVKVLGIIILIIFLAYSTFNYIQTDENTINVGYLPSSHHSALFVADKLNMYSKSGLNVNLIPFRSGADVIEALEKGQIDVGYCGIAPTTVAISKGAKIKIVAPANTGGSGLVVPINSSKNISTDLIGKKVAIPNYGSVQDVILHELLFDNNITSSEVNLTTLDTPLMPSSLKNGKIDAFVAWEPYATEANMTSDGDVLLYSDEWWDNHPCCVIVARDDFIKERSI